MALTTLFFSYFAVLLPLTWLTPSISTGIDVLGSICNNGTVFDADAYRRSYQVNLDEIRDDMRKVKFAIHEHGDPPQKMYVLAQCVSDLSPDECNLCWSRASDLLSQCFPATGGRFYLDGCFIRADNYSFYQEPLTHQDTKICASYKEWSAEFKGLVKEVTESIAEKAPYSQGFSVARKGIRDLTVYGLGICWRTLDDELCKLCLADGALSVSTCLPSKEGLTKDNIVHMLVISVVGVLAIAAGFCCGKCIYLRASQKKKLKG